jgi:hypothetical protein
MRAYTHATISGGGRPGALEEWSVEPRQRLRLRPVCVPRAAPNETAAAQPSLPAVATAPHQWTRAARALAAWLDARQWALCFRVLQLSTAATPTVDGSEQQLSHRQHTPRLPDVVAYTRTLRRANACTTTQTKMSACAWA